MGRAQVCHAVITSHIHCKTHQDIVSMAYSDSENDNHDDDGDQLMHQVDSSQIAEECDRHNGLDSKSSSESNKEIQKEEAHPESQMETLMKTRKETQMEIEVMTQMETPMEAPMEAPMETPMETHTTPTQRVVITAAMDEELVESPPTPGKPTLPTSMRLLGEDCDPPPLHLSKPVLSPSGVVSLSKPSSPKPLSEVYERVRHFQTLEELASMVSEEVKKHVDELLHYHKGYVSGGGTTRESLRNAMQLRVLQLVGKDYGFEVRNTISYPITKDERFKNKDYMLMVSNGSMLSLDSQLSNPLPFWDFPGKTLHSSALNDF